MKFGDFPPEFWTPSNLMSAFKDQVLLVLVNRLGGTVDLPMSEIDETGQFIASITPVVTPAGQVFRIEVRKKD